MGARPTALEELRLRIAELGPHDQYMVLVMADMFRRLLHGGDERYAHRVRFAFALVGAELAES
jgi:hypothetical protein